jgi:hypothetical protein
MGGVRREHLARVVRAEIGAETRKAEVDFAALYRHAPQQILHAEINAVPGFTGRDAELAALAQALWAKGGNAVLTNSRAASAAVRGLGGVALARALSCGGCVPSGGNPCSMI